MGRSASKLDPTPLLVVAGHHARLTPLIQENRNERGQPENYPNAKHVKKYRDVAYIRKDIISKLMHYGELSQNRLMSYCGLNAVKHKLIISQLLESGLISRHEEFQGNKRLLKYRSTQKGILFCQQILDPYENLFPRDDAALFGTGQVA